MRELHILNLGAGIQSTRLFLEYRYDVAIFADTQEEPEAVYRHLDWLDSLKRTPILRVTAGKLGDDLVRGRNTTGGRFAAIPAFTTADAGATVGRTRRQCSKEYKTEVIERAIRRQVLGLKPRQRVSPRDFLVHQYFGISHDERSRASRIFELFLEKRAFRVHFPLVEQILTRANCIEWLQGRVPHEVPRSACVFCPFHSDTEWDRLRTAGGGDWARAVEVDAALRSSGAVANRDMQQTMYVHRSCKPLTQIEFHPRVNAKESQLGFGLECEGVCGV